jgi:hypothetical protein
VGIKTLSEHETLRDDGSDASGNGCHIGLTQTAKTNLRKILGGTGFPKHHYFVLQFHDEIFLQLDNFIVL